MMMSIIIWLASVIIGYVILYFIMKAAVNNSETVYEIYHEIKTGKRISKQRHDELLKQMEEIKILIRRQDEK